MPSVPLSEGNVKKYQKLMKIGNIVEEILHIFFKRHEEFK